MKLKKKNAGFTLLEIMIVVGIIVILLGLAIRENGVLVTFDRHLKHLAGAEFAVNLLVLQ